MKRLLQRGFLLFAAVMTMAASPVSDWTFVGTCTDCPTTGNATLQVTTSGNTLNFHLTYASDWLTFTMPSATLNTRSNNGPFLPFSGNSFTIGPTDILWFSQFASVTSFGGAGNPLPAGTTNRLMNFVTAPDGQWQVGDSSNSDFGTNGVWTLQSSAVPEPSTMALVACGIAALVWRRRSAA